MVTRPDIHQFRPRPRRRRIWPVLAWVGALVLSGTLVVGASLRTLSGNRPDTSLPAARTWSGCATGAPKAPPSTTGPLIVLSDDQAMTRMYGTLAANLASHFGRPSVIRADAYQPGLARRYRGIVFVGANQTDKPLPVDFLYDVIASGRPVLWLGEDIDQLAKYVVGFQGQYGWTPGPDVQAKVKQVWYRGTPLSRAPSDTDPLRDISAVDPHRATVLATAVTDSGRRLPWAVYSDRLTYISEVPLDAAAESDRYLAVADLLTTSLAPNTGVRHRALVRLEDIGPEADPNAVEAAGRLLHSKGIPFSFGVFPVYMGPVGPYRREIRMRDRPLLVRAITYLLGHGGTMVLHGYTHQSSLPHNPDNGESGQEFEFFATHYDTRHDLVYDGPVPGDSAVWADGRFDAAAAELRAAHLPVPRIVEFPHYAASATDYRVAATRFSARYDRGQYYSPDWNGRSPASPYMFEQFAPYLIRDTYGSVVIPENLGFVQQSRPMDEPETPASIVANARSELVVRDNTVGFYYHPFLGTKKLTQIVDQIKALGYRFVSPCELP